VASFLHSKYSYKLLFIRTEVDVFVTMTKLNLIYLLVVGLLYWYEKGNAFNAGEVIEELEKIPAQAERINTIIRCMRSFVRSEHHLKF